jgi:archaellum biogenesis ATPase FlaH
MPTFTSLLKDFHDYARGRLEGFTGREWLVEKVRAWLGRADAPPFLLILGEPGIGKSAFAAHLWLYHGLPHAVHFCIAGRSGTVEPLSFLESLNAQLKDKLPGFAEAFRQVQEEQYAEARQPIYAEAHVQARYVAPGGEVTGVKIIQQIRDLPPERALDLALRRPLQRLAENGSLPQTILLVDALDEARTYFSRPNILDLLARAHDFPPPVRFILLSRLEPDILGAFREMPVEVIHAESEENRRDVTAYLHCAWEEDPDLRQAVQAWGAEWDADTFAARLGERGEWNFLYLRGVLPLIACGEVPEPAKLPAGLDGFHEYLLRTRIGEREWRAWGAELLETLLALQEQVTLEHLARLLGWEARPTHQRLLRISELLDPAALKQDRYWRYHWSLAEFVADRQRAGIWWCDLQAAHRRIAYHYLSEWGGLEQGLPGLRQRETRRTDEGYGLRHLGTHLLAGGETETLRRLLTLEHERRNLWFTVQEEEGQAAVFLEDVRRLWAWAREEDARAAAQGNEAPHLGDEIRCALIEASLHSLAGNIPPALLAALVEKGIWTPAQGLAYARQVPDPWQRAEALEKLAPHLPLDLLEQALATVGKIQWEFARAQALVALVRRLAELGYSQEALATAKEIQGECYRAKALAAIAPHLPPEQRFQVLTEALAIVREIPQANGRAEALFDLVPHLPLELLPMTLAAAKEIRDVYARACALAALVPYLLPQQQHQVLVEALATTGAIQDEYQRAEVLAVIVPYLPPDLLTLTLAAVREMEWEPARIKVLTALAPHLPPDLLTKALVAAREIWDEDIRTQALAALAPHLPLEQQFWVLAEALVTNSEIQDAYHRTEALAALIPLLPIDLLPQALTAAREIQDANERAWALTTLALYLPPEQQPQVLTEALASIREIEDDTVRARALATLAPLLPPDLLPKALTATRGIRDANERAWALAILAPYLPPEQQPQVLTEALASAREIEDDTARAEDLDEDQYTRAIGKEIARAEALAAMTPYLPPDLLPQALDVAREIGWKSARAEALAALAHRLAEPGHLQEALAAAGEIRDESDRARTLAVLAPHLPPDLLKQALAAVREIRDADARARALAALASHLPPGEQPQVLAEALVAAGEIRDESDRARVLADLAPHLPPEQRTQVLAEALATARKIWWADDRARALVALAPHLLPEQQTQVLAEALAAAREIQRESDRAEALVALAPHLPPELQPQVLAEALAAAMEIEDEWRRADALAVLGGAFP